jgi:hypothetical protein
MMGVLSNAVMGLGCLGAVWINFALMAADLHRVRRRAVLLKRALECAEGGVRKGEPTLVCGVLESESADAGGASLPVRSTAQVGRALDPTARDKRKHVRRIAFGDRTYGGRVGRCAVRVAGGPRLLVAESDTAWVWTGATPTPVPAHPSEESAWRDARSHRGLARQLDQTIRAGARVWVFGILRDAPALHAATAAGQLCALPQLRDRSATEDEPLDAPLDAPLDSGDEPFPHGSVLIADIDPRVHCAQTMARVTGFISVAALCLVALSAWALVAWNLGAAARGVQTRENWQLSAKLAGAALLAYFLLLQPAVHALKDRLRWPHAMRMGGMQAVAETATVQAAVTAASAPVATSAASASTVAATEQQPLHPSAATAPELATT